MRFGSMSKVDIRTRACWLSAATLLFVHQSAAADPRHLAVCFEYNNKPYAFRTGSTNHGLDIDLSMQLGKRLGESVKVQWFDGAMSDNNPVSLDANALLSSGVCDLVAGYALMQNSIGPPEAHWARVPEYAGGPKRAADRPVVPLGTLHASLPYRREALVIVSDLAKPLPAIEGLADLRSLRIGITTSSLAGAVVRAFDDGALAPRVISYGWTENPLDALKRGDVDVAVTEISKLDVFRNAHPDSSLQEVGPPLEVGVNIGLVALASNQGLLDAIDAEIRAMREDGSFARLSLVNGMTYVAPTQDQPSAPFLVKDLTRGY